MKIQKPSKVCSITGASLDKESGLRIILSPDNHVFVDDDWKLPGNDLYVLAKMAIIKQLLNSKIFEFKFNRILDIQELLEPLLANYKSKILSYLALAKKAGKLVIGKSKLERMLRLRDFRNPGLIIQAYDTSEREKYKVNNKIPILEIYSSEQLSAISKRDNTHFLLVQMEFSEAIVVLIEKINNLTKEI